MEDKEKELTTVEQEVEEKDDKDNDEEDLIDDSITSYQEEDYEEEGVEEENTPSDKKKLFLYIFGVAIVVALLLLVIFLFSLLGVKNYSYEKLEKVLKQSSEKYMNEHKNYLPSTGNDTEVSSDTLISNGYMKDFSSYGKKNADCTGKVVVHNDGNSYTYTPYLSCGNNYKTSSLGEAVKENNKVTTEGYGLYKINNDYVFRGEIVNNYVKLEKGLWRIVKITSDNKVILISTSTNNYVSAYDDRYNTSQKFNSGINNFMTSRLREKLDYIYKEKDSKDEILFTKKDKTMMVPYEMCIASRAKGAQGLDGAIECREKVETKVGLLSTYEFMQASTDKNCVSAENPTCSNYNYLTTGKTHTWWLATPLADTTDKAYAIQWKKVKLTPTNSIISVRATIAIKDSTVIAGGSGTEDNPYIVK